MKNQQIEKKIKAHNSLCGNVWLLLLLQNEKFGISHFCYLLDLGSHSAICLFGKSRVLLILIFFKMTE